MHLVASPYQQTNKYQFITFKDLSATFKASMKVSFDTGLLNFVTDIHFSVIIHNYSKFVHKNYFFDKKTLITNYSEVILFQLLQSTLVNVKYQGYTSKILANIYVLILW